MADRLSFSVEVAEGIPGDGQAVVMVTGEMPMVLSDDQVKTIRGHVSGIAGTVARGTPLALVAGSGRDDGLARSWLHRWRRAKRTLAGIEEEVL